MSTLMGNEEGWFDQGVTYYRTVKVVLTVVSRRKEGLKLSFRVLMQGVELCGGWCGQQILPLKDPMCLSGHNPFIHYKMATSSMEVRERHMWVE